MAKKKKNSQTPIKSVKLASEKQQHPINCYEGERLDDLLLKLRRSIEAAKQSKGNLPEKIWIKQQFAVGVNEVTRVLERMSEKEVGACSTGEITNKAIRNRPAPLIPLQAVILASDVNPRMLIKHVPHLASSLKVPVVFVKDNRGGSLRLGELLNLKTSMAIGVKARESIINQTIDEILLGDPSVVDT